MFRKQTVKAFSIVAIVLSVIGLLLSVIGTLVIQGGAATLAFFISIVNWGLLLWSSIIGLQLSSSYELYEEEYKKIGLRIIAIIVAFILFFFIGLTFGLVISIAIFVTLWALKSNLNDWKNSHADAFIENNVAEENNQATKS